MFMFFFDLLIGTIPEARSSFEDSILTRPIVRDTQWGRDTSSSEEDGIFGDADVMCQLLHFLFDHMIILDELFGLVAIGRRLVTLRKEIIKRWVDDMFVFVDFGEFRYWVHEWNKII